MARGTSSLQAIRALNEPDLRAIRRRIDWIGIDPMGEDSGEYTRRLRKYVKGKVDSGDVSWQGFWEEVIKKVVKPGGKTPRYQIKDIITGFEFSFSPIGEERKEEEWLSGQLYGALQAGLHDDFSVYLEYEVDRHRKHRVDIFAEISETGDESVFTTPGNYLIELKRTKNMGSKKQLVSQIRSYHNSDDIGDRKRTFVVLLSDIDLDKIESSDNFNRGNPPFQVVNPKDLDILTTGENVPPAREIKNAIEKIDKTEAVFFGFNRP